MIKFYALGFPAMLLSTIAMAGPEPITLQGVNVLMKPAQIFKTLTKSGYDCPAEKMTKVNMPNYGSLASVKEIPIKQQNVRCINSAKEIFVSTEMDYETHDWKSTSYIVFGCEVLNTCRPFAGGKYKYGAEGATQFLNERLGEKAAIGELKDARREQFCTSESVRGIVCFDDSGQLTLQLKRP